MRLRDSGGGQFGVVALEPDVDVEEVDLLGPEQAGERLALDPSLVLAGRGGWIDVVELVGLGAPRGDDRRRRSPSGSRSAPRR